MGFRLDMEFLAKILFYFSKIGNILHIMWMSYLIPIYLILFLRPPFHCPLGEEREPEFWLTIAKV